MGMRGKSDGHLDKRVWGGKELLEVDRAAWMGKKGGGESELASADNSMSHRLCWSGRLVGGKGG